MHETLTTAQILGGALIVVGAIIISFELQHEQPFKLRGDVLGLMFLSSLLFAVNFLLFKIFAVHTDFWTTALWESVGFIGFGLVLLLFAGSYRRDFVAVFVQHKKAVGLNITNELVNIVAKITFNYVSLLTPLALAWVGVGFQPVFVLAYSVILALFFPFIAKENVFGKHLVQKILSVAVMLIGAYILSL